MSNLLTSLTSAAASLGAYEQAMTVVQNDTVNTNTPGYAAQNVNFTARPFDVNGTAAGGVQVGSILSSRDEYAEQNVQLQQSAYTYSSTSATVLSNLQPIFDLQNDNGVAGSLNTLFSAFSALSTTPNDPTARQSVINDATLLANAFNTTANALGTAITTVTSSAQSTVTNINNTLADIAKLNVQISTGSQTTPDPGIQARLYSDLESLSQNLNITTQLNHDGSIDVSLAGQRPLVVGASSFNLSMSTTSSSIVVQDASGNDITSFVRSGKLGALVAMRNNTIPGYQNNLNQLAKSVADTVNTQLAAGIDQNGNAGAPLFTYQNGNEAQSLSATSITSLQIAAAAPGNPGGNGNAVQLADLQNQALSGLGNSTFTGYLSILSAQVGRDVSGAQSDQTTTQSLLSQAQNLRSQSSAVSLDTEAAKLEQYQRTYDAMSKMISVIDNMTQTLLDLIPPQ